jgi:hypothetical protein
MTPAIQLHLANMLCFVLGYTIIFFVYAATLSLPLSCLLLSKLAKAMLVEQHSK